MKKIEICSFAPDFELLDTQGNLVKLSSLRGKQPVVLVMTRGFI
jgi:peroxiredoxin